MREARLLFRCLTAAAVFAAVLMLTTTSAFGESSQAADFADTIHVIQPKPVLQKGRLSLTPRLGMTVNDAIYRNFKVGANANFHITERFYIGGVFQWYDFGEVLGGVTQTYRDVNSETRTTIRIDAGYLNWAAGGELGFVPLFGKFALFNRSVIFYDVALSAGAVWADSTAVSNPSVSQGGPAGTVSLSTRLFLNNWMAFNVEVRDVIFQGQHAGGALTHSVTLGMGMSFYIPFGFEYSE